MAELKTQKNDASVEEFLSLVPDAGRRADAQAACVLFQEATAAEPVMWGSAIVGFGEYTYTNTTGKPANWPAVGFSPRKAALTVYIAEGLEVHGDLLHQLGKHTTGVGCV